MKWDNANPKRLLEMIEARGLRSLFEAIARDHYVTVPQVLSGARTRTATAARLRICEALRRPPYRLTHRDIGDLIGRDTSTVIKLMHRRSGARSAIDLMVAIDAALEEMRCA